MRVANPLLPPFVPPWLWHHRDGELVGPQAAGDWQHVVPEGLYKLIKYVEKRYNHPEVIITGEEGLQQFGDRVAGWHSSFDGRAG